MGAGALPLLGAGGGQIGPHGGDLQRGHQRVQAWTAVGTGPATQGRHARPRHPWQRHHVEFPDRRVRGVRRARRSDAGVPRDEAEWLSARRDHVQRPAPCLRERRAVEARRDAAAEDGGQRQHPSRHRCLQLGDRCLRGRVGVAAGRNDLRQHGGSGRQSQRGCLCGRHPRLPARWRVRACARDLRGGTVAARGQCAGGERCNACLCGVRSVAPLVGPLRGPA
mmetsp:Transcript_34333/g.88026  ORF Transcript_34333/g.88026 Transcript_34333/m.88026 type:complete len:223 (-) Transcript_34333:256-924(-)